jgi:hypothetical protein
MVGAHLLEPGTAFPGGVAFYPGDELPPVWKKGGMDMAGARCCLPDQGGIIHGQTDNAVPTAG